MKKNLVLLVSIICLTGCATETREKIADVIQTVKEKSKQVEVNKLYIEVINRRLDKLENDKASVQ